MDAPHTEPLSVERRRHDAALAASKEGGAATEDAERDEAARKHAIWTEAYERWQLFESGPEAVQRAQELEDLQFDRARVSDIWPADQVNARKAEVITAGNGVQVQVSQRPTLVVNKLGQPVTQIINEGRQARIVPVVKAKPGKANDEDAEVAQGLLRGIESAANADAARHWALTRGVKCGRGYWRVETAYANDGDFELDILITRFKNQGAVYMDPFHAEPDGNDALFCFITDDLPPKEFTRRYPKAKSLEELGHAGTGDGFSSQTDIPKTWVSKDSIRVAEYFYVVFEDRWRIEGAAEIADALGEEFAIDAEGLVATEPDPATLPPMPDGRPRRMRKVQQRRVKWCLLAPGQVLAEADWPGRYIPVIQFIAREFNVNGETSYKGAITDAKDSVRVYCYAVSAEVEAVALAPRAPWVAAYGQLEKYRAIWQQANLRNFAWLPYDPIAVGGTAVAPPQRQAVEPAIGAIATLVQQSDSDIKAQTGRFDASLGNMNPQERSGKALRELKQQGELSSSDMLANYALAVRHECRVVMDLAQYVYIEPGRLMTMLGDEPGNEKRVMLNQDVLRNTEGEPEPYPKGAKLAYAQMRSMMTKGQPLPKPERYDIARIAKGASITMDVGPSYKTQRDENIDILQGLVEGDPAMKGALADIIAEEIGGPVGRKVAERMRLLNPKLATPDGAEGLPPEAQAQIAQRDAQIQEMGAAMQQMQQALETQQAKQQAQIEVARIRLQGDLLKAKAKAEADAVTSRAKLEAEIGKLSAEHANDTQIEEFKAAMQKALQDDEQRHDIFMAELDAAIAADAAATQARREGASEARGALRDAAGEAREEGREVRREGRQERRDFVERREQRQDDDAARSFQRSESAADRDAARRENAADRKAAAAKPKPKK